MVSKQFRFQTSLDFSSSDLRHLLLSFSWNKGQFFLSGDWCVTWLRTIRLKLLNRSMTWIFTEKRSNSFAEEATKVRSYFIFAKKINLLKSQCVYQTISKRELSFCLGRKDEKTWEENCRRLKYVSNLTEEKETL